MRLLMITRRVDKNDPQTGFAYNWVKKMGQKTNQLKVICLSKGEIGGLPDNTEVFSMGKEKGKNRLREFINFQKGAMKFIKQVDGVFCHQNIIYTVLIAPYAKLSGKRIVSWFGHKQKGLKLHLLNILADKIVTSSAMGFQLDTAKRVIIGQGIDIDIFKPGLKPDSEKLRIISVGRISPIKNYETLIETANILKRQGFVFEVWIVGRPGLASQKDYFSQLKKITKEKQLDNEVKFLGGIAQSELVSLYQQADLAVNLCPTGAPDKAGLEAMACGVPLLACNKSFAKNFGSYGNKLLFEEKNSADLAQKIMVLKDDNRKEEMGKFLRQEVVAHHNLDNLLDKIIKCF